MTNNPNSSATKCPKCEKTTHEMVEDYPLNSKYKHLYIRCGNCKTFLATIPYHETNVLISKMQEDIDKIKKKLEIF